MSSIAESANTGTNDWIAGPDDLILVTGATGFIGSRVVVRLVQHGFRKLRCFVRSSCSEEKMRTLRGLGGSTTHIEVIRGNLMSPEDCSRATKDVKVVYHLAAGRGQKSFPDAFMNSVVTTRNLLDACAQQDPQPRFVNISSFSVYTNTHKPVWRRLDEACPVEVHPELRGEAYPFAKVKQDEMVVEYGKNTGLPYVILRPGHVYGPGNEAISGRVGVGTFGIFLHLGGGNRIPFTYVDNCAEAILLAGLKQGIEGEIFNIVDDDLPSSRRFLRMYKKNVAPFKSLYVPHSLSYLLCWLWESASSWSDGQLPPVFNRKRWHSFWKTTRYSNRKLKERLGWTPQISMSEGMNRYFDACRRKSAHA